MQFPLELKIEIPGFFNSASNPITINEGLTILLGPNGGGKTQFLRELKRQFIKLETNKKVRLLSAGRLFSLENYRSDLDGRHNGVPNYEGASFGSKDMRRHRHTSESLLGDFHTLSLRTDLMVKVRERLISLFKRDIKFHWDSGNLKVEFIAYGEEKISYASAKEASGLLHLVTILAALYDDEVGVLLIDEPELSLHPQYQAFLLREIKNMAGDPSEKNKKLVIISTHSSKLIDIHNIEKIHNIIFFKNTETPPLQISRDRPELKKQKIIELISRIGQAHKEAFFSSKPILVEGHSDMIICNFLNGQLGYNIETSGGYIIPIIGKGEIPAVVKLMSLMGKKPVVLADLDLLADGISFISVFSENEEIKKLMEEKGHNNLHKIARDVYNDFKKFVIENWEDLSKYAMQHNYWKEGLQGEELLKVKLRSSMAIILNLDTADIETFKDERKFHSIRRRLNFLLDSLEKSGCFILRKGTIEEYYQEKSLISSGKPLAATKEIEFLIQQKDDMFIKENYPEVIRLFDFVTDNLEIDETKIIIDFLLAVVTPILNKINKNIDSLEVDTISSHLFNDCNSLFDISILETKGNKSLKVELKSEIMDIEGFPIIFPKGCNPFEVINQNIKRKR
ncbi:MULTISPECIES: AAA family ATPase [Bacillus]|uniref:ATP-dependent endonuclease n=1 Tax=Bacillus cereus TaxID=1396 RepID=A0A9X7LZR7_BACCE|nr:MULTISPECIES: AAA family ATPase [Bacillus]KXH88043.1 hypothetical protein AU379_00535 [Bacillus sp. JH7]QDZ75857.1 ATP-dependent endonuclease [Bacillus cereus]